MIVNVQGVLEAAGHDWVHVRVGGGVTIKVSVPANAVSRLGEPGAQVSLHTHLLIRDEQIVVFGFPDAASLALFNLLTGISGVGPRLGLSLLSTLDPSSLQIAVESGDVAALASAPGVGRRTASRIILEMKGKIEMPETGQSGAAMGGDAQVVSALTALGYSLAEARAAVDSMPEDEGQTVEDRIRVALQQFANRG